MCHFSQIQSKSYDCQGREKKTFVPNWKQWVYLLLIPVLKRLQLGSGNEYLSCKLTVLHFLMIKRRCLMNWRRDFHLCSRFGDSIQTVSISKLKFLVSDQLSVARVNRVVSTQALWSDPGATSVWCFWWRFSTGNQEQINWRDQANFTGGSPLVCTGLWQITLLKTGQKPQNKAGNHKGLKIQIRVVLVTKGKIDFCCWRI